MYIDPFNQQPTYVFHILNNFRFLRPVCYILVVGFFITIKKSNFT